MRYHLEVWISSPSNLPDLLLDVDIPGEASLQQRSATANDLLAKLMRHYHLSRVAKVMFSYYSPEGECIGGKVRRDAVLLPSDSS